MRRLVLLLTASACAHGAGEMATAPSERPPEAASPERARPVPPPEEPQERPQPATAAAPPAEEEAAPRPSVLRERLVEAARGYLGKRFRGDCSGFVRRVFSHAEVDLPEVAAGRSRSEAMYRTLRRVSTPRPGDLAFFHATYDRDRVGHHRNRFTHVALVETVDGDRLTLIHRGWRGIERIGMNLSQRHDRAENSQVRLRRPGDRPGLRYLSGELFAGFASAFDDGDPAGISLRGSTETSPDGHVFAGGRR